MPSSRQNIPPKTRRILDIRSLKQCAYPDCTNALVEPGVGGSGPAVTGDVCHIHAVKPGGARWKAGLTKKELNSPANLIFLCKHHHSIVDGQSEYYTAEMLKEWKREHETRETSKLSGDLDVVRELVDEKIRAEIDKLRKSRFFEEFDEIRFSLSLGTELIDGVLSVGTEAVRSQALAWCARILSPENLKKAREFLEHANESANCHETIIAAAFLTSQQGMKNDALSALAEIDSPMSRTAAVMIVAGHEGWKSAVDWLESACIDAKDLDPDGKLALLKCQLDFSDWMAAQETCNLLTDDDLQETPILHQLVAITHLLSTVPEELRSLVLGQIPFDADRFELDDQESAIEARRVACRHFVEVQEVALRLRMPRAAAIAEEYALWLELRDPDESENGRNRLTAKLRDLTSALRFVRLGVQFSVELDLDAVEREIERQIVLNGRITIDAALARFALVETKDTAIEALAYLDRHQEEISGLIGMNRLQSIRIRLLSRTGQFVSAKSVLDSLIAEGLSKAEINHHRQMIAEAEGADPVEGLKEQFRITDSLSDLGHLVDALEARNAWDDLCEYGAMKFERTHALHDAERYAVALYNTQKNEQLLKFLESNQTLLPQSKRLQLLYCYSLYHEGMLLKACAEMEVLSTDWDDRNYRELWMNLGISMGDWNSLSEIVANDCTNKKQRSAIELIRTAHLAICLDSPQVQVRELLLEAVSKGNDDPKVFAAAYYLATKTGWDNEEVSHWLNRAARLSGEDGPIWKMTLKDVLARQPEWNRQQTEIRQKLLRGEMPTYLAGRYLNKSLVDLVLYPSLMNPTTADPRHRFTVLAYSEKRQPSSLNTGGQVGVDATSLLTLGYLNLLDETLGAFDTVHIPHTTMGWLFEEKENVGFHQPSRIHDARRISELMAKDELEKLSPTAIPDTDLSDQIGIELSQLIAEAEKGRERDGSQHIVIRSYPEHRLASLMEEEADLSEKSPVLSSCKSIVDYMQERGRFTAREEKKARDYLQLHEQPWPNEPKIENGAVLYLDEIAVGHLLHLGILGKLKASGFTSVVSPGVVSEVIQLLNYEKVSYEVTEVVERIRSSISSRIESGKVKAGKRARADQSADPSVTEHPTLGIFFLSKHCNAIIADDRYLNQHPSIDVNGQETPLFTTLDLIDALVSSDRITTEDRLHHRTRLRQAGYLFVPVREDELIHHLCASPVKNRVVDERAELKAIRENILHVRMSDCPQSLEEGSWLSNLLMVFRQVLKNLWKKGGDLSHVRARSDWILNQIEIRVWAHSLDRETGTYVMKAGRTAHFMSLLFLPVEDLQDVKDEYWKWVEDRVLAPTKEQYPDLYFELVEWYRRHISDMANMEISERDAHDE